MRTLTLTLMLLVAACASAPKPPMPEGEIRMLNPDRWRSTDNDLRAQPGETR